MTRPQIIALQSAIGAEPDGFWGPLSIAACKNFLRRLMPHPSPWPDQSQDSLSAFYGRPGDESQLVAVPVPVAMYYEGVRVKTIRCHRKVAASLVRALTDAAEENPGVVARYDGCYNHRPMRGGTLPSLHARGAAIDLDAAHNGNKTTWPVVATMPFSIMKAFAREGWIAAGAFWGRDAMHFQATT